MRGPPPVPAPLGHRSCKPPYERGSSDSSNTASAFTKHTLEFILRSIGNSRRLRAHVSHIKTGFPATYCSICGGPFGNPYTDLISESPDSKLLDEHVEDEFEWLSSSNARLFGVPSSLENPNAEAVLNPELQAYIPSSELPSFFGDFSCRYGSDCNSFSMNGWDYRTHWPVNNGDILFAMHKACAVIIQRVYEAKCYSLIAQGSLPTIRHFYDKLRRECPNARRLDEWGNVYWPHDYYGAIEYWDWGDWEYKEGCSKFLFDPLHDKFLTRYALKLLKPSKSHSTPIVRLHEDKKSTKFGLEALPTEILDRVVLFLPATSAFSLRLASSKLACQIPLNQRFFREQLVRGQLVPHIWDLDAQACRNIQRCAPECENPDEYWDWRQLNRDLGDAKGILERDPDDEEDPIPRGLWNRCRLWLTVIETEVW